ncbi:MAG: response regulator transcription factor [Bacteroidales bacterium]|nr:response regulator transcription factor [Bacteroidales bacterium]
MDPIRIMIVDDEPIIRKALKLEINGTPHNVACGMNDDGEINYRSIIVLDTYANGAQLMAALDSPTPHEMPDYLLLDMEFQGEPTGGIFIADRVHKKYPDIKIAIFSGRFDNPLPEEGNRIERMLEIGRVVFESLEHGAQAFVSKNAAGGFSVENVLRAIESLERGERYYFNYPVMLTLKEAAELYIKHAADLRCNITLSNTEQQLLLLEAAGCTASEIANTLKETDKSIQERQKELSRKLDIVNKSGARIAKAMQYRLIDPKAIKYLKR